LADEHLDRQPGGLLVGRLERPTGGEPQGGPITAPALPDAFEYQNAASAPRPSRAASTVARTAWAAFDVSVSAWSNRSSTSHVSWGGGGSAGRAVPSNGNVSLGSSMGRLLPGPAS